MGNGTFVVDYAYRMEACPTGADNYLRSDQTAVRIGRPEGATRLNVTFTWDPGNPTADRLRFTLVDRDGMDVAPVVEGVSPLTLDLAEADLAKTTEDPWIAGEPAPCHGAPGGVLDVGSAPGQVVAYEATWS